MACPKCPPNCKCTSQQCGNGCGCEKDCTCPSIILQFSSAAIAVRDRVKSLHNKISKKSCLHNYEIDLIIEIYEKLFDTLTLINDNLAFQIIPIIAYILIATVLTLYNITRLFLLESILKFVFLLPNFFWISSHAALFIILIHSSVSTMKVIDKIYKIAYEIVKSQKAFNVASEKQFSKFVKLVRRNNFKLRTAFFDIDLKLLMQCIAASITFIVITCQFETSLPAFSMNNSTG
ncbi:hypothetical protein PVAND_001410 [Polypedilum vanderplanki]|uniref:Gustatory receptor n=1 Tax=Polypedilum vanderplanki TaxID=319348 RepID=A0A9J6BND2_POLVA|nr:hypothetical protein PVAND_001410 [Polypedilum vanderplanki]